MAEVRCAHDKMVPIEHLVPNPRNPNTHPERQIQLLAKIIDFQGWRAPITVSNRSGFIVRGHGRYAAAKLLQEPAAPVDYQDYENEAQEWADLVADNRIAELAEINDELLGSILTDLKGFDLDLEFTGFELKEVDRLLDDLTRQAERQAPPPEILRAASLEDLKPSPEEYETLKNRKFLVEFSGGKDSSAATAWLKTFFPENPVELMFVDLGADFIGFHIFLKQLAEHMGYELNILRSEKTVFDAFLRKGDWPMFIVPYCHELLHKPIDDYIRRYDPEQVCAVRGGRLAERAIHGRISESRFRDIERMRPYLFFEPLYFGSKEVSESVLKEAGVPVWEGYSYGLRRTACRVCPGQRPAGYAAIRANFPDVWDELIFLQKRLGPGGWQRRDPGFAKPFEELADLGQVAFEAGNYLHRPC